MKKHTTGWIVVTLTLVSGLLAGSVQAQATYTRQNNTTTLNLAGAWSAGGPPTGVDIAQWNNTSAGNYTTVIGASVNWGQVKIVNPGGAITIGNSASSTLTLNGVVGVGIDMSAATQDLTISDPVTLGGAQTWTVASGRTLTMGNFVLDTTASAYTLTVAGAGSTTFGGTATISGAGGLTKNSTGLLSINGTVNNMTGNFVVNNGTVLNGGGNVSLGTGNLTLNNGVLMGYWGGTFNRALGNGNGQVQIFGNSGFAAQGSTGTSYDIGGTSTLVWGSTYFNPTTLVLQDPLCNASTTVTLSDGIDLNGADRTISVNKDTGSANLTGAISNSSGTAGLTKTGAGTLILAAANTYNGGTTISAGTLRVAASDRLGNAGASNTLIFNGGILQASGTVTSPSGRGVTMTQTGIIDNNGQAISIAGGITGVGGLTKNGTGTLTLSGANSYGGTTTVNAGTLAFSGSGTLGSTTAALSVGAGTLNLAGLASPTTVGAVTITGAGTIQNGSLNGTSYVDSNTGFNATISANLLGSGVTYTKSGSGTTILSGVNTYTGATTVNAGTLLVNTGGSIASGSAVSVASGGMLGGNGTIAGTVNLASGALLSPGASAGAIGTLTISDATASALTLGGITGIFDLPSTVTTPDQVAVTGGLVLNNSNTVLLKSPLAGTPAGTYTLMTYSGAPTGAGSMVLANGLATMGNATISVGSGSVTLTVAAGGLAGPTTYTGGATSSGTDGWNIGGNWNGGVPTGTINVVIPDKTAAFNVGATSATIPTYSGDLWIGNNVTLQKSFTSQHNATIDNVLGTPGTTVIYMGNNSLINDRNSYSGSPNKNIPAIVLLGNATYRNKESTNGAVTPNFNYSISGPFTFTLDGSGNNTLNAANSFAGLTMINASPVLAAVSGSVGNATVTMNGGSTLNLNHASAISDNANTIRIDNGTLNYGTTATASLTLSTRPIQLNGAGQATIKNSNTASSSAYTFSIGGGISSTAAGAKTLTLGGANTGNNTISGNIVNGSAGTIALTKADAGTWVLSGASTYSGATTVSAGRLSLNNLNAIQNSSVSVTSGGTLGFPIAGTYSIPGTINIAGTGATLPGGAGALWFGQGGSYSSTLNNPINMTAAATIGSFGNVMTPTLGGAIGGTGPLTIQSQGGTTTDTAMWNLSAASTYSGNTILASSGGVRDMTIKLGLNNALPITTSLNLQASNSQAVNTFTTFDLNGFNQTLTGLTDTGGTAPAANNVGKRVINSSGTLSTLTINNAGAVSYGTTGTRILAGTIGGLDAAGNAANNLALTKTGAGDLTLSGVNTYTGNTTISNGRITANAVANLSSGASSVVQSGTGQIFISSGTGLNYANNFNLSTLGFVEAGDPTVTSGAIRSDGNNTFSGTITLSGNSRIGAYGNARVNTISGKITGSFAMSFYGLNSASSDTQTYILSNTANDFTGDTQIDNKDYTTAKTGNSTTLRLGAANVIPDGASAGKVAFNGTSANDLTILELNGNNETVNGLSNVAAAGAIIRNNHATTASTLTVGAGDTTSSFSGTIVNGAAAALALAKTGAGTLTLSGLNTYTGTTTINAGTLQYGINNAIATGAVTVDGATAVLDVTSYSDNVGTVTLAGGGALTGGTLTSTGTFEMQSGSASTILAGSVIALNKTTAGTVTLSGTSTYTGATTINDGTLLVNGSLAVGSAVAVTGGSLRGQGTVAGTVTVGAAGSVMPGTASIDTLTVGNLNVSAMANGGSGKLVFRLDTHPSCDKIDVTGTLTIGSGLLGLEDFTFTNAGGLQAGTYTLITSGAPISGSLAGTTTGFVGIFPVELQIVGNDIVLVVTAASAAPVVASVTSSKADGAYKVGEQIDIEVTFNMDVVVSGSPYLTMETGATDRNATFIGVSGPTLTFRYTVDVDDTSTDLDYIAAPGALNPNGGTIRDSGDTENADLTLVAPGLLGSISFGKAIVIDTTQPTVGGVSATTVNGRYKAGDVIAITVAFNEPVWVAGGTPSLALNSGGSATYASGNGTATLTFNYTVQAGDTAADLDYSNDSALALNSATIRDAAGNNAILTLATPGAAGSLGANKDIVIDGTAPTLVSMNDNNGGADIIVGDSLIYTVTFDEAMAAATVDASDFDCAGTALFNVTGVTQQSPTVFDVAITTVMGGSLILRLKTGAVVTDLAGNALAVPVQDDTTITVNVPMLKWDANNTGAGWTDGGAAWLGLNQWWTGSANVDWSAGNDAVFGNNGTGGGVTLASSTTVNSLTFNPFGGTYTLGSVGVAITLNNGITMNSGAGAVILSSPVTLGASQTWLNNSANLITMNTPGVVNGGNLLTVDGSGATTFGVINNAAVTLAGAGGFTKNGSGNLTWGGNNAGYSGTTTLNGGVTTVNSVGSIGSGNLTLNGGVYEEYWSATFSRGLGNGAGKVQILGGTSGFSENGSTGMTVNLGGATATVVWGALNEGAATGFFNPSTFVLQSAAAQSGSTLDFQNGINLNGATRTISVLKNSNLSSAATISGSIIGTGASGLIKQGVGYLALTGAANTYAGGTTISAGTLLFNTRSSMPAAGTVTVANGAVLGVTVAGSGTTWGGGTGVAGIAGLTSTANSGEGYGGQPGAVVNFDGNSILNLNVTADVTESTAIGDGTATSIRLIKSGANKLTLSGNNSYTGGTTLSAGALAIGSANALGSGTLFLNAGTIQSDSATARTISNAVAIGGDFTVGGTGNLTFSNTGASALGWTRQITVNTGINATFAQAFSGSTYGITKAGAGTLTLTGNNTYTGTTTIKAGKIVLNNDGDVTSSTVLFQGGDSGLTITGGSGVTSIWNNNGGTFGTDNSYGNVQVLIDGAGTAGSARLTNVANLRWMVVNNSTISLTNGGQMNVNGEVQIGSPYYSTAGGANITIGGGTATSTFTGNSGQAFYIGYGDRRGSYNNVVTVNSGGVLTSIGNMYVGHVNNAQNAGAGPSTANQLKVTGTGTASMASVTVGYSQVAYEANANVLEVMNGGTLSTTAGTSYIGRTTVGGAQAISDSNTATVSGAGSTWNAGNQNITVGYAVASAFSRGNILTVSSGGVLNNVATLTVGTGAGTKTGNKVVLNGGSITATTVTVNTGNSIEIGTDGGSLSGNITYNGSTFIISSTVPVSLAGIISGSGGITQSGSGTTTLSGANTYTGNTSFDAGILNAGFAETSGVNGPFGKATAAGSILFGGGTLQYSSANQNDYSGRFSISGNQPVSIDVNGQTVVFGTPLQGTDTSLTLADTAGGGRLTLSGANTYTGATTINAGTLKLASGASISDTPTISIAASATFDVSLAGITITGSPVQTLACSSTSGTAAMTATSQTVILDTGARLSFQAAGGASSTNGQISVTGNVTLYDNVVTVNVTGAPLAAGTYRLLDCTGTLSGSANATPSITGTVLAGGYTVTVSTTAGFGGHVDLIVKTTPVFSGLTASQSITYGTTSVSLAGTLSSATVPVAYPADGETVTAIINGQAVNGTVSGSSGAFTINYNHASLATDGVGSSPYTITYAYAGNGGGGLNAAANDSNTALTVTPKALSITAPTVIKIADGTVAPGTVTVGTLSGFVGSETVTATGTASPYPSSGVGSAYSVTVTYTLAPGLNGGLPANYSLADSSITNASIMAGGGSVFKFR